jgi:repressor LexA
MPQTPLTQRQDEAYEYIRSYIEQERRPPTLQEIGDALGIASTNAVYKLLSALESKGWIEREKHAARSIRLVDDDTDPFGFDDGMPELPVVEEAVSDQPETIRAQSRRTFSVDRRLLKRASEEDCLVARSGDDGMNGAGIYKGDLLVVEEMPWEDLANGTVAAFLLRERLVARTFRFANNHIHLRPEDRHYSEDTFPPRDPGCYVIGRVVSVMRVL